MAFHSHVGDHPVLIIREQAKKLFKALLHLGDIITCHILLGCHVLQTSRATVICSDENGLSPPLAATTQDSNVFDLEMLQVRGRVAVIFSDLNISRFWGNVEDGSRLRGLQFGANLIVSALTQKMAIGH